MAWFERTLTLSGSRPKAADNSSRTSIWLLPEDASVNLVIKAAAEKRGRTPFLAHLSLATGPKQDVEEDLARLAARTKPLTLNRNGVIQKPDHFTQSYALAYAPTPQLASLFTETARLVGLPKAPEFTPHMSLTYGKAEDATDLNAASKALSRPMRFSRMVAVTVPARNATQADVAAWRVGTAHRLGAQ